MKSENVTTVMDYLTLMVLIITLGGSCTVCSAMNRGHPPPWSDECGTLQEPKGH